MTKKPQQVKADLVVLGAGSGGLATAKRAANYGARAVIIENSRVGGTCVIRGCIPKKLMAYASHIGELRHLGQAYGWTDSLGPCNWETLISQRNQTVDRLERMHEKALEQAGVELLRGDGQIDGPNSVKVGDRQIETDHIVIATGGRPTLPTNIAGIEHAITSDAFWDLSTMPKSAVIVGGSYIAVEFATILQGLGCNTTLLVRSQLLRGFDRAIVSHFEDCLAQQGITVVKEHVPTAIKPQPTGGYAVSLQGADQQTTTLTTDACVLFAIGRVPNTDKIGLEGVGIETNSDGSIPVDENHATNVPTIYAVGDVTGRAMLTPVAIKAGRTLADKLFASSTRVMSYDNIPTAVFSHPPIATVGQTEETARAAFGDDIEVFESRFAPLIYAPCPPKDKVRTLMRLVVRRSTQRVLGCHMVGVDAPEIIQGYAAAIHAGATKETFDNTVAVHPSSAEEFVLMR